MQFRFQDNLGYQLQAIQSVTDLFKGQQRVSPEHSFLGEADVCTNQIHLTSANIWTNRDEIISRRQVQDPAINDSLDFCIQMETGTGKTYVYLRTIYELHKRYGLHKFMIIVPSVAIRSGVLKTLEITREHFRNLYGVQSTVIDYNSKKKSLTADITNGFVRNSHLSILVMTTSSFNKDDNIVNTSRDTTSGEKLLDLIAKTLPVIIMDEPQEGMDAAQTKKYITKLSPLLKLRYSATHKTRTNVLYVLDPVDAYAQNLVKKIEVWSIFEKGTESNLTLELAGVSKTKTYPKAKLLLSVRQKDGTFKTKAVSAKSRDNLRDKTNNPVYEGWLVENVQIDPLTKTGSIKFTNGQVFGEGEKLGVDTTAIFREQIKYAVHAHFQKRESLRERGIKPVCLFFIDKVDNYILASGLIRTIFEEEYQKYCSEHQVVVPEVAQVHGGYFARTNNGDYTDSEGSLRTNSKIYELILRDKEKLLSLDEPLEFIFSHSALGVGWDNPNVFTICTLNETTSASKKRQEIGRGLRICVNQDGERVYDAPDTPEGEETNVLTVVPNQSYKSFASTYQQEITDDTGSTRTVPTRNKRQGPNILTLRQDVFDSLEFQELWQKINRKTSYQVQLDETKLIEAIVTKLNTITTSKAHISLTVTRIESLEEAQLLQGSYVGDREAEATIDYPPVDILEELINKTSIAHQTALSVLQGLSSEAHRHLLQNPVEYISLAIEHIKRAVEELTVEAIKYTPLTDRLSDEVYPAEIETYKEPVALSKSLYTEEIFDSKAERAFAAGLEAADKVKILTKLPKRYVIDTPLGTYNPDFGFVVESKDVPDQTTETPETRRFYFVVETKGGTNMSKLRPDERIKIECAAKHFEALGFTPLEKSKYIGPVKQISDFNAEVRKDENLTQAELF